MFTILAGCFFQLVYGVCCQIHIVVISLDLIELYTYCLAPPPLIYGRGLQISPLQISSTIMVAGFKRSKTLPACRLLVYADTFWGHFCYNNTSISEWNGKRNHIMSKEAMHQLQFSKFLHLVLAKSPQIWCSQRLCFIPKISATYGSFFLCVCLNYIQIYVYMV